MALIPSNSKSNKITDNGINLEVLMILFVVIIIGQKIFEGRVHSWLSWLLIVLLGGIAGFCVLPNSKNHGQIGYVRLLNFIKFNIRKIEERSKLK